MIRDEIEHVHPIYFRPDLPFLFFYLGNVVTCGDTPNATLAIWDVKELEQVYHVLYVRALLGYPLESLSDIMYLFCVTLKGSVRILYFTSIGSWCCFILTFLNCQKRILTPILTILRQYNCQNELSYRRDVLKVRWPRRSLFWQFLTIPSLPAPLPTNNNTYLTGKE